MQVIKKQFSDLLPKTMAICRQYTKCGKPHCRCISSGELHGPYYFHFYRVDGRLKKSYIRKADAEVLWESYSLQREIQRKRAADRKGLVGLCRNLRRIDKVMVQMILSEASGAFE